MRTACGLSCRSAGNIAAAALVDEVAHGGRWKQEGEHATY